MLLSKNIHLFNQGSRKQQTGRIKWQYRAVHSHHPFPTDRPHRLRPKSSGFLFALACHTELSLLLHDVIGDGMVPFAAKIAPPVMGFAPHLIHGSVGPPESSSETACRSVHLFWGDRL